MPRCAVVRVECRAEWSACRRLAAAIGVGTWRTGSSYQAIAHRRTHCPREYQWLCQCGWRSTPTPDAIGAHAQLEDHRMQEWYKATGNK